MASAPADRMRALRKRRKEQGIREVRLKVLDLANPDVVRRIRESSERLDKIDEEETLRWIEAASYDIGKHDPW